MSVTVQRDRYDHPICRNCGHANFSHGGSICRHLNGNHFDPVTYPPSSLACDCKGWERDPNWPPPIIVRESVQ